MYEQRRNQNCKEKKKRNHSQEKYDGDQAAKSSSFVLYKKKKIDKEPEFKTLEIREADILFERKASSSKKKKNKEDDNNQIIVHGDPVAEKKKKKDHKEPKKLAQESSDSEEEPTKTLKKTFKKAVEDTSTRFPIILDVDRETSRLVIVQDLDVSKGAAALEKTLRNHFRECGQIVHITIGMKHITFSLTGLAYVEFYTNVAAVSARALETRGIYTLFEEEPTKKTDADEEIVDAESEKKAPKTPSTPHTSGTTTLFAGNLSFQIEEANMREFFKSAGEIVDLRFGVDSDGRFKRYGFIEFESEAAAHKALKLNEQELLGCPIRLDLATAKGAYTTSSGFGSGGRFGNYGGRGDKAGRRGGRRGFNKPNLTAPGTGKPTTYTRFR